MGTASFRSTRRRRTDAEHGVRPWARVSIRRMREFSVGEEFAGHRIEGVAGQGGMGVVYRATDLRLKRVVALKLIAPRFAEDPDFRRRFEQESELAASIRHPNVITIYSAGEAEGSLYIRSEEFAGHRDEGVAGQGGMGVVYRATDLRLKRVVALKLIAPRFAEDPDFRRRFEQESELAASIRHPNVITIYSAGEAEGSLYI